MLNVNANSNMAWHHKPRKRHTARSDGASATLRHFDCARQAVDGTAVSVTNAVLCQVILFLEDGDPALSDRELETSYEYQLNKKTYDVIRFPVQSQEDLLPIMLGQGLLNDISGPFGLIVTDSRCLSGLQTCLDQFFAGTLVTRLNHTKRECPCFAVGADTCNTLREMGFMEVYGDEVCRCQHKTTKNLGFLN